MPNRLLILNLLFIANCCFSTPTLTPFTTDGCSAFPEGTLQQQNLWLDCCTQHDIAYWQGGTYMQRVEADEALMNCVSDLGEQAIGIIMLLGVRIGGTPFIPTDFRWGYGWPYPRSYGELNNEEKSLIRQMLPQTDQNDASTVVQEQPASH